MSWTPRTLYAFVSECASTRGDAEALVTPSVRWSYRAQADAVRRTAKAMHALGVRRGDFVGILMGNDENWVSLFYAAATLGAVTVPVNTRFKSAELAFCLAQADVKALFLADRFLNIDFLSFLRAAEPAVDRVLPGAALPLLQHVVVIGDRDPGRRPELARFPGARRRRQRWRARSARRGRAAERSPVDPVHVRHDRLSEGRDAHPRQHAA